MQTGKLLHTKVTTVAAADNLFSFPFSDMVKGDVRFHLW
jgi:hypothetical protein